MLKAGAGVCGGGGGEGGPGGWWLVLGAARRRRGATEKANFRSYALFAGRGCKVPIMIKQR